MEAAEFKSLQALDANREGPELTDIDRLCTGPECAVLTTGGRQP